MKILGSQVSDSSREA